MDDDQQFCLRWNNHQSTLISVFDTLLENETLVDCTLAAEGKFLKAHKVVLSACSPYFATLLQEQYDKHPIFILKDVKYQELRAMMDYMYRGEVNISQDQLAALLKAAESLQIKGLSDNRSSGGQTAPKPDHHRATMPTGKLSSGYTLEQTKRARIAGPPEPEIGSREGSSSPSRRRRKVRRRSIENAMTDVHDNSNSSQQQQQLQQTQSNASGLGAITAAASALAAAAAAAPNQQTLAANIPLSASTSSSTAVTATGTTLSSSKKTDNVKGTTQQTQHQQQHDAINTENAQGSASVPTAVGSIDTETSDAVAATSAADKSNHKQMQQQQQHKQAKDSINASGAATSSDLVIEPKAEYDDEANDEPVEDLTLDEEDMGMDDLDQNAGTSQGGEGSSQGYAPWQHDRSQDELLLATQEAQQRDPQDLSNKLAQIHKENTAPNQVDKIQKATARSILNNNNNTKRSVSRNSAYSNGAQIASTIRNVKKQRMSMSDVSDMLYEFYRTNANAKAPKSQDSQQQQQQTVAVGATAAAVKYVNQTSPTSAETNEPSSIAAIATKSAASETAPKNLKSDEMMADNLAASFHPPNKLNDTNNKVPSPVRQNECNLPIMTAIPTSVVVPPTSAIAEPLDIKPIINPATGLVITPNTSVIKPVPLANTAANPQAAAIAAALIRDGYHSFQQQIRAHELIKFHTNKIHKNLKVEETPPNNILETFLRQTKNSECDTTDTASDNNNDEGDDEDDSRYNGFDDIHLMEGGSKPQFPQLLQNVMANNSAPGTPGSNDYYSDESQKFMNLAAQAQAQAFRNLDFSFGDFASANMNDSSNMAPTSIGADGEPIYECRHCGKKYRWKSTLRRHENVECGGKEPSHQCPYCPYKSKQRGNLGVHVRKHHSNLPQLASKRRSKYSMKCEQNSSTKYESNPSSANVSDESNSKLIIDCSK